MRIIKQYMLVALLSVVFIAGCTSNGGVAVDNRTVGTAAGIGIGGLLGSLFGGGSGKIATTIVGAAVGGLIGNAVGASMDQNDYNNTGQALESAPTGQPYAWTNPDTGNQYAVTPTNTYYPPEQNGQPCRTFTATVQGEQEQMQGTACRNPDGSWSIVSTS